MVIKMSQVCHAEEDGGDCFWKNCPIQGTFKSCPLHVLVNDDDTEDDDL